MGQRIIFAFLRAGVAKAEIARRLQIGRTSVRRILARTISGRNRASPPLAARFGRYRPL